MEKQTIVVRNKNSNLTAMSMPLIQVELSSLTRQCLVRRIPDIETLRSESGAWEQRRNEQKKGADWQFTTEDARIKLRRLYPKFNS